MPTSGIDHEEPVVDLPLNAPDMRTIRMANDNNSSLVIVIRDYLYLAYATLFPMLLRRIIEFVFLLMAVFSFFLFIYVHINFLQTPANCLDHVQSIWPRDGILRIEIIRSYQRALAEQTGTLDELFTVEKSYEREYKLKQLETNDENISVFLNPSTKTNNLKNNEEFNTEPLPVRSNFDDEKKEIFSSSTRKPNRDKTKSNLSQTEVTAQFCSTKYPNSSIEGMSEMRSNSLLPCTNLTPSTTKKYKGMLLENNIVEYSLEFGLLMLSPNVRSQLGIPVMLVVLEPTRHKCFGGSINQFLLKYFLGYNGLLTSSIKSLHDKEQNEGYLRNVVTGSYDNLVPIMAWRTSYITAFFVMIIITVSTSMFLRYMQYQICVFAAYVLELAEMDFHGSLSLPATLLLSVILATIGLQAIMSEFFKDISTGFYIMFIVWLANNYDSICSSCLITKKHWQKFFCLYLFSFYAYHYRFSGQNRNLNLICSCLFILHSMIYFFHHFELPYVVQQSQLMQVIIQRQHQEQHEHQHQPSSTDGGEDARQPDSRNPVEV